MPPENDESVLMSKVTIHFRTGLLPLELEHVRHKIAAVATSNTSGVINHIFEDGEKKMTMVPQDSIQHMELDPSRLA